MLINLFTKDHKATLTQSFATFSPGSALGHLLVTYPQLCALVTFISVLSKE